MAAYERVGWGRGAAGEGALPPAECGA
jgi:hypothetical protein